MFCFSVVNKFSLQVLTKAHWCLWGPPSTKVYQGHFSFLSEGEALPKRSRKMGYLLHESKSRL